MFREIVKTRNGLGVISQIVYNPRQYKIGNLWYMEEELKDPVIYMIYINADLCEGKGPMEPSRFGYFLSEEEAWKVANQIPGIQGRTAPNGDWRNQMYSDVQVRSVTPFDKEVWNRREKLLKEIEQKQKELDKLKSEMLK